MLHREGKMDDLEWSLYLKWFDHYAANLPVKGIVHLTTSAGTSKDRIATRGRSGEEKIPMEYLESLHSQHERWIASAHVPVLNVSTDHGHSLEEAIAGIKAWIGGLLETQATQQATN
jgi:deoxyadenosine/deoxycytidine kinase